MVNFVLNIKNALKENTDLRISPEVIEEVKSRLETEFVPLLAEALAERAKNDDPPRKTIQERDCVLFDHVRWWAEL